MMATPADEGIAAARAESRAKPVHIGPEARATIVRALTAQMERLYAAANEVECDGCPEAADMIRVRAHAVNLLATEIAAVG